MVCILKISSPKSGPHETSPGPKSESSEHFLLDCFLYTVERQNLYHQVEHFIPNFSKLTKKAKFLILTEGINTTNPEFYYTNVRISLATQYFIVKTKRFS